MKNGSRTRRVSRAGRAEDEAGQVLAQCGIVGAPVAVDAIAHALGLTVERAVLGDDISGLLVVQDGRGVIGVSVNQPPTRQRFTIAHEIGHFLLHRGKLPVFIDKQFLKPYFAAFRDSVSTTGEDRMEREANSFAAALLMPTRMIHKAIQELPPTLADEQAVQALAKVFQVSRQAMSFRLANLAARDGETRVADH